MCSQSVLCENAWNPHVSLVTFSKCHFHCISTCCFSLATDAQTWSRNFTTIQLSSGLYNKIFRANIYWCFLPDCSPAMRISKWPLSLVATCTLFSATVTLSFLCKDLACKDTCRFACIYLNDSLLLRCSRGFPSLSVVYKAMITLDLV